ARKLAALPRDAEGRTAIECFDEDFRDGYAAWACSYETPNPLIQIEEPLIKALIPEGAGKQSLDAACGTGRHCLHLVNKNYQVVVLDASEAILRHAQQK